MQGELVEIEFSFEDRTKQMKVDDFLSKNPEILCTKHYIGLIRLCKLAYEYANLVLHITIIRNISQKDAHRVLFFGP